PAASQMATAMPLCRSPTAPDQSIAAKCAKRSATLFAQSVPVRDPLPHLSLETALDRVIVDLWVHLLGPVIGTRETVLGIVVIGIVLAVADVLHQLGRCVEDVLRRHQAARVPGAFPCC